MNAVSSVVSDKTPTKKAALNAVATALDYGARLVVNFVINPLLLTGLGDFGYGAWQILGRLIGYISPAGGRPTQALKWTIANHQASSDYQHKRCQVGSAVTVWFIFMPLLASLGAVLVWYVPGWLKAPPAEYHSLRLAAGLLVANLILTDLALIPYSVLRGENLGYKRMGLTTIFVLLGGGLTAWALYLKSGITGVASANLLTTVLNGLIFFKVARSHVHWFGIAKPVFADIRRYLGLSGWFLLWTLIMQLLKAGDVVVLGFLDSAQQVTHYSLTKFIPETIIGCVAMLVFGITPGLGGIIGSRDLPKANRVRGEIMLFTWLIVTVGAGTMLLWNDTFVRLWVGDGYYAGNYCNLLIILMAMQFVFIRNDANIIDLTLNLSRKVLLGMLSIGISLAVSGVLISVYKMGIAGLTLGFIAGQSLLSFSYPALVGRYLGISGFSQFKAALRPGLMTIALLAAVTAPDYFPFVKAWFDATLAATLANLPEVKIWLDSAWSVVKPWLDSAWDYWSAVKPWLDSAWGYLPVVNTWVELVLAASATVGIMFLLAFYIGLTVGQRQRLFKRAGKVFQSA